MPPAPGFGAISDRIGSSSTLSLRAKRSNLGPKSLVREIASSRDAFLAMTSIPSSQKTGTSEALARAAAEAPAMMTAHLIDELAASIGRVVDDGTGFPILRG
jgi:hypothetical protein